MNQIKNFDLTDVISHLRIQRPLTQAETVVGERCLASGFSLQVTCQHVAHAEKG